MCDIFQRCLDEVTALIVDELLIFLFRNETQRSSICFVHFSHKSIYVFSTISLVANSATFSVLKGDNDARATFIFPRVMRILAISILPAALSPPASKSIFFFE